MNYEEKRELRLQISQLLADAGLNQKKIKDIVDQEIKNKVDRAIDQKLKALDSQCYSGDYIKERLNEIFSGANYHIATAVKEELKNRIIKVELKNVEL